MKNPVLEVKNVSKSFQKLNVIKNVSLSINEGELFGLIGPNGAGKTTMFRMLLGLLEPSEGEIFYNGESLSSHWSRGLREQIGYLPENVVFYDYLTGRETLNYFAKLKNVERAQIDKIIKLLGIEHYIHRNIKEYSKGMRQRIGLAQAILNRPKILFLDEPTTGLDPKGITEFFNIIFKLKDEGTTIVMTSHILREIQGRVDRIGIMLDGKLHAVGRVSDLKKGLDLEQGFIVTTKGVCDKLCQHMQSQNVSIMQKADNQILITYNSQQKIKTLNHLMLLESELKDIEILSPGLDDIFLKLTQEGPL